MKPIGPHHGFIPSSAEDVLRRRVKAELRKRMRGVRQALPAAAWSEKSQRIVERLATLDPVVRAKAVALFWPIESRREVELTGLDRQLRARGARVAYPRIEESGAMSFRFVSDAEAMQPHDFGHHEPAAEDPMAAPGEIDVVVVPALAVDPRGHRIGYGGGHYDRTLPAFVPPAVAIVVAFDFQLVADAPDTEGDVAAQWIVTDARVLPTAAP